MSRNTLQNAINWADVEDESTLSESRFNNAIATPSSQTRTVTDYVLNEKGQKVKVTRKIRTVAKQVKVNKAVSERRHWQKFGDCAGVPPGPEVNVTTPSYERIHLDLRPKKREDEKEENALDKLQGSTSIVVCRNCGETGHWTLKCPKRSQIAVGGAENVPPPARAGEEDERTNKGRYVPVHMRGESQKGVSSLSTRDDSTTLRVTNLSEDVTEDDLRDLFSRCGKVSRIYLAKDRQTNLSRGFAFINFESKRDAEKALQTLNGHGYDNLILRVEWAKPREDRE